MYKLILFLLLLPTLQVAHSADANNKGFLSPYEKAWIMPIQDYFVVLDALRRKVPEDHVLIAVNTEYFVFNEKFWDPLLIKALQHDMLIDEDDGSEDDKLGFKQAREGVFVALNTPKIRSFIEELCKQTKANEAPVENHPNLFSSALSCFRSKNQDFHVSGLTWPLPLTYGKHDGSASLIPSKLRRLKSIHYGKSSDAKESEDELVVVDPDAENGD